MMKRLELNCKTGFHNTGAAPIIILDEFCKHFYDTSILESRVNEFNLPAGEYYVQSGRFQQMASPVDYPLFPLPNIERRMPQNPERFKINYLDNPKTATINWDKNKIEFDKSLRYYSFPELIFILYHEYGHRYYDKNEEACDLYSANRMLKEGYNPEQIGYAIINTLSDANMYRKERLIEKLVNRY